MKRETQFYQLLKELDREEKTVRSPWKRDAAAGLLLLCQSVRRFEEAYRTLKGEAPERAETPEVYQARGIPYFSPELRWSCLLDADPTAGKEKVRLMLQALVKAVPALRWILDANPWLDQLSPQQLAGLVQDLDRLFFQESPPTPAELERLFELILIRYPVRSTVRDRRFETRAETAVFLAELLAPFGGRIYDPCCGLGNLLLSFSERLGREGTPCQLYGHEADESLWRLAQARLYLLGVPANLGDAPVYPLTEPFHLPSYMDVVVGNPSTGVPSWHNPDALRNGDSRWRYGLPPKGQTGLLWLQHMLSCLDGAGVMAVFLKCTTLSSANPRERLIRQGLLEDGLLEAVILLPGRLFYRAKAPMALWILRKGRGQKGPVLMADAAYTGDRPWQDTQTTLCQIYRDFRQGRTINLHGFCAAVSPEELRARGGDLDPRDYLRYQQEELPTQEQLDQEEKSLTRDVARLLVRNRQVLHRLVNRKEAKP